MGLDVYAGSLGRYYAREWETIVQQYARANGQEVYIVRFSDDPDDSPPDPDEVRSDVLAWRAELAAQIGPHLSRPLDWDESAEAPYFTDKPDWAAFGALKLWAAYSEQQLLERPQCLREDWSNDAALLASQQDGFRSDYPNLLNEVEIWLPLDFDFQFEAPDPWQNLMLFGSAGALCRELAALNQRTWQALPGQVAQWRSDGDGSAELLEDAARFGFAILSDLASRAMAHRLVLKLDY